MIVVNTSNRQYPINKIQQMSGRRTLGISRNKWSILAERRTQLRAQQAPSARPVGSRFSRERLVRGGEIELVEPVLMDGTLKKPLVEDLASVSTMDTARPQWMGHYEECQQLLRAVEDLRKEMLLYQNKRLTCVKVSEEKGFEMKIYECARQATMRIKRSQLVLELLKREEEMESPANARICKSITFKLATQIQQVTKNLRTQQRSFVEQRKQFQATEKVSFLEVAADNALAGALFEDGELLEDEAMLQLESRNEEIKKIVQSIFELNDIYKELGQLVLVQGSLLDRIDQNIDDSQKAIANGTQKLVKAEKHQKRGNRCACGVMIAQMVAIGILMIVLMVKWN